MRASGLIRFASAISIVATLASCGGDATAPKVVDPKADSLIDIMNAAGGIGGGTTIVTFGGFPIGPMSGARCAFNGSSERFECEPQTTNGITTTMWYQYLDASNHPLSAYSASTVTAIHTHTTLDGKLSDGGGGQTVTITISGVSDQTMGGLLAATQTLSGTSTTSLSIPNEAAVTLAMTTNLTLPQRGSNGYPTGTIVMTVSEPGVATETITITFNGTSIVTITDTEDGSTCTMDLSKPDDPGTCTQPYASFNHRIPASVISGGVRWPPLNSR